jgi:hypothetical protein
MAGMKSIDEARNVLEEAALMTTETVRAFYGIVEGADVDTAPGCSSWPDTLDAWDKASGLHDGCTSMRGLSSTTWSASPRRSKPGAGGLPQ